MRSLIIPLSFLIPTTTVLAQKTNWIQATPKNSPSARFWHMNAHDFVRARTIVFGGSTAGGNYVNDLWEYDGKNWTMMTPTNSPPGRWLAGMVYDFIRLKTLLFGGRGTGGYLNDTWVWDGRNWTQMKPQNSPSPRWGIGMAYDSARQRTVLFGGNLGGNYFADTWEWDGVNWTKITTKNAPSPRNVNLAYDSVRKRVVLFGGNPSRFRETWEYDGKDWAKMTPVTQPSARCCFGLAYDPVRQRTVLFGGASGTRLADTWEYDGKTWTQVFPAKSPPARHDWDLMVYDPGRRRMVLFGGYDINGRRLGGTWEYADQSLTASPSTISIATGGTHTFSLDAGTAQGGRLYWIFGSVTGTAPGVTLPSSTGPVTIPLNPDVWTDFTISSANSAVLPKTRGVLDAAGKGSASFIVPRITNSSAIGARFHHAYLVYDARGNFYMASNAVELTLVR